MQRISKNTGLAGDVGNDAGLVAVQQGAGCQAGSRPGCGGCLGRDAGGCAGATQGQGVQAIAGGGQASGLIAALTLPWPPKALSPNARLHWAVVAKAKKAYRAECALQARAQGVGRTKVQKLHIDLLFFPPSRRSFDLDNALARMKSGLDGLADVLGVDDKNWKLGIDKADQIGGMVKVEVRHVRAN